MVIRLPDHCSIRVQTVLRRLCLAQLVDELCGLLCRHLVVDLELMHRRICEAGTRVVTSNGSCSFRFRG